MKVYVISYKSQYSDGSYSSGVCYVFNSLEKAKNMLETIKQDEISEYKDNGIDISNRIIDLENAFKIENGDDIDEYSIDEMQVK